jgi:glycerophosphoryl diester phosphodiesterase
MTDFFLWGHRGAAHEAPENTLASFRAAEEAGADGIELDVHLSRDGVPVVIHDAALERTTDGRGAVNRQTFAEMRLLDAGRWFAPSFAGERLPTLEEVLAWSGERLRINIEIKSAGAGRAVRELLAAYPRARVLVSSFDHSLLETLRQEAADLPLGFLVESRFWRRALKRAAACGAESFHPRVDLVSAPMVAACRVHGLAVYPWTVDDPSVAGRLRRLGAAGIFTNDPRKMIGALPR